MSWNYFKSLSSRLIAASWWMFVLLMMSCYTANLAAFLTIDKMDSTINSVEDLLIQNQVQVGAYHENSTVLRLLKVFWYLIFIVYRIILFQRSYMQNMKTFKYYNLCFRNPKYQLIQNWQDS